MAAEQLRLLLNGPVVAGVGATVDAGLHTDKYHVLPWNPDKKVGAILQLTDDGLEVIPAKDGKW